jgi:hypothetical protein
MNIWPAPTPAALPGSKVIKAALVALFVMSMATLTIAASSLPVDTAVAAAELG